MLKEWGKPDCIFMDWDNTIVGTNLVCQAAFNKLFQSLNIDKEISIDEVITVNNQKFSIAFDNIFHYIHDNSVKKEKSDLRFEKDACVFSDNIYCSWLKSQIVNILINNYKIIYSTCSDLLNPLPKAEKFLDFIKKNNIITAVLSNKPHEILSVEVRNLQLDKYFSYIQGIENCIREKPDDDLFKISCRALNVNPKKSNIWFIGDAFSDMDFALNCGMKGIYIGPLRKAEEEFFLKKYGKHLAEKKLTVIEHDYDKIISELSFFN